MRKLFIIGLLLSFLGLGGLATVLVFLPFNHGPSVATPHIPTGPVTAPAEAPGEEPKELIVNSNGFPKLNNPALENALSSYQMQEPLQYGNLTLIPITHSTTGIKDDTLTLSEALKKKVVTISEVGSSGTVPQLSITSRSDQSIYVPFGAIVTGGKQDRMVRKDIIVKAGDTARLDVYCIEQGRWRADNGSHGVAAEFEASESFGSPRLKASSARKASQGEIWSRVQDYNESFGNLTSSSNFQGNYATKSYKKQEQQLAPLKEKIESQADTTGLIGLVDGKIVAMEVYVSAPYFQKIWPQIYSSYVLETGDIKDTPSRDPAEIQALVQTFLNRLNTAQVDTTLEENGRRLSLSHQRLVGNAMLHADEDKIISLNAYPAQPHSNNGR